ncbi:MAG: hypothetical protein LC737_05500 [Chloroflexi bacterium]|nr:hypothetical protein [Chloroflexota bacterium]
MTRTHMPPIAHKLYAVGLIVIVAFVLVAWVFTAFSVSAKTISNLSDHDAHTPPDSCIACHQSSANAPRMTHLALPSCGYCHR